MAEVLDTNTIEYQLKRTYPKRKKKTTIRDAHTVAVRGLINEGLRMRKVHSGKPFMGGKAYAKA